MYVERCLGSFAGWHTGSGNNTQVCHALVHSPSNAKANNAGLPGIDYYKIAARQIKAIPARERGLLFFGD